MWKRFCGARSGVRQKWGYEGSQNIFGIHWNKKWFSKLLLTSFFNLVQSLRNVLSFFAYKSTNKATKMSPSFLMNKMSPFNEGLMLFIDKKLCLSRASFVVVSFSLCPIVLSQIFPDFYMKNSLLFFFSLKSSYNLFIFMREHFSREASRNFLQVTLRKKLLVINSSTRWRCRLNLTKLQRGAY